MRKNKTLEMIHEDLETLKRDMIEIKKAIILGPELKDEIKMQVREAKERVSRGEFVDNKNVLKEFGL